MPSPSSATGRGRQAQPRVLLNVFNFAPAPGMGGFWPPAQPAGGTTSHLHVTAPEGGCQLGEGPVVPPAYLGRDASPYPGSTLMEEGSVAGCFKPISKRLAAPPWGVYFQAFSAFIQSAFRCLALGFLQLQAASAPPARASSLIPQHTNDARSGNESHGLSRTWFP